MMTKTHKIQQLVYLLKLKEVNRAPRVINRQESSAEHTWACMILAEYFISNLEKKVDRLKVLELLLYHDLIEIESGDSFAINEEMLRLQKQEEKKGFDVILSKLPEEIRFKFQKSFIEYEYSSNKEAKLARAIDKIEPMLQVLTTPGIMREHNLNEEIIRKIKYECVKEFPETLALFEQLIELYREQNEI